tara:strand:- start:2166 stop:2798 length:633 start_codon:yes stop_codon:yes gene_type:complete
MTRNYKEHDRAYKKAYYQANKDKIAVTQKAYYQANKDKIAVKKKVKSAAYYQANKEKIAVRQKAYREANKEKLLAYREANKERILANKNAWVKANKERVVAYYQDNKEKFFARNAKRRAAKRKQIPIKVRDCPIEKNRVNQIYKLSDMFTKATGVQHHVDHMWPLSKKGPHWSGNLQIITATENQRKSAKLNKNIKATVREMLKDIKDAY